MKPLHIVQVSYDDSVFAPNAPSDMYLRQTMYAQMLAEKRPGSQMTVVVLTTRPGYQPVSDGPVAFIPLSKQGVMRLLCLFRCLLALAVESKIDLIATQTIFDEAWTALAVAGLARANVLGQIHFDIFSPLAQSENLGRGIKARFRMKLAMRLLRYLCAVRVVGQRLRTEILARGLHSNVAVLPVPVTMPAAPICPIPKVVRPGRVLYIGRLAVAKNLWLWLRVAQCISQQEPEVEFQWAGDGPLRTELLAEADRLGLGARLRWLGAVPYEQLPAVYKQATVFLLTSSYEGFGRVVVEAGLQGLPVVAPRITGVEDIVLDGETGFLHAPDDEAGLAASVLRLLRDPALCARMGVAAQARMRLKFDPQQLAEQWVELLISAAEETA